MAYIQIGDDVFFISGTGVVSGNDKTIYVGGDWDLDEANAFNPGTGTVIFNGAGGQNVEIDNGFDITFNDIIFQNAGTKSFYRATTVNGDFSLISTNAFVDFRAGSSMTITGTLSQTGGEMRIWDNNFPTAGIYSLTGGEVEFLRDVSQTIPGGITFNDLTIRALSDVDTEVTLSGDITVNDDININYGNVTLDVDGHTITLYDTWAIRNTDSIAWNGGTLIHKGGAWSMDADFNASSRPFGNLILEGTSYKQVNSNIAVNGNLTIGTGVELFQYLYSIENDGEDTITFEANSILDVRVVGTACPTNFDHYILDETSIVELRASGNQTLFTNSGSLEYGIVRMYSSGSITMDGDLIVQGDFDMDSNPTLLDGGNDLFLNGSFCDLQDYTPSAGTQGYFRSIGRSIYCGLRWLGSESRVSKSNI